MHNFQTPLITQSLPLSPEEEQELEKVLEHWDKEPKVILSSNRQPEFIYFGSNACQQMKQDIERQKSEKPRLSFKDRLAQKMAEENKVGAPGHYPQIKRDNK